MSTFDGFITEIPQIRVDFFRVQPHRPPPLACFLSHVHSDHLSGLASFKGPFIYCSTATREILLRIEKYPHRMNFAKGVTEVRKQTYKHLSRLLKPIPLETPTSIELAPGITMDVTMFDANHCIGAVMFLFEYQQHSVLYTGDIRSEDSWVTALARNPALLPFIPGPLGAGVKRLDCIYLDTTFAAKIPPYTDFPSKAQGLTELIQKVVAYPMGTKFYFHAWTFGYEDVFRLLAKILRSRIHLDAYRHSIYTSVSKSAQTHGVANYAPEAAVFSGFDVANNQHSGILTMDDSVRLHCCELGSGCWITQDERSDAVHIKPVVTRHDSVDISEAGLGGGHGDLDQIHEIDVGDTSAVERLIRECETTIANEQDLARISTLLHECAKNSEEGNVRLEISADPSFDTTLTDSITLPQLTRVLQRQVRKFLKEDKDDLNILPKLITFPYARHSSYHELGLLVKTFRPRDVYPCTAPKANDAGTIPSMAELFGDACHREEDGNPITFRWDREGTVTTPDVNAPHGRKGSFGRDSQLYSSAGQLRGMMENANLPHEISAVAEPVSRPPSTPSPNKHRYKATNLNSNAARHLLGSQSSRAKASSLARARRRGFEAMNTGNWSSVALQSTREKRQKVDEEL